MFVKEEIVESLCLDAGEHRVKRAKEYLVQRRVQINEVKYENPDDFEVHAKVRGTENYYTHLIIKKGEIEDLVCSCRDYEKNRGACKHIIASLLEFKEEAIKKEQNETNLQTKELKGKTNKAKYRSFYQIVNELYNEDVEEKFERKLQANKAEKVRLEPKLLFDNIQSN